VYKTECHYDPENEGRHRTAVKRDNSAAGSDRANAAETILSLVRSLPESDALDALYQLRSDPSDDPNAILENLLQKHRVPSASRNNDQEDFSVNFGVPSILNSTTGVTRVYGHTTGMGLVEEDENDTGHKSVSTRKSGGWTQVTRDINLIFDLFHHYFAWSHPIYQLFSKDHFLEDFKHNRTKYCSSLLVNALCAYGCRFSDRPGARIDPGNSRTAGDHFWVEAKRLLDENQDVSLTTVQALAVMSMREASAGRDSSGFMYAGRCLRMAIELGLHLHLGATYLDPVEEEIRRITFWGCFIMDSYVFTFSRPSSFFLTGGFFLIQSLVTVYWKNFSTAESCHNHEETNARESS
jgi:hypothetical protein